MNPATPALEPISDEQLQAFLAHAHADSGCPTCATNRWHRLPEQSPGVNYAVPGFVPMRGPTGLEVVVLYCMQCGFVRQHAAHLIRAWGEAHE